MSFLGKLIPAATGFALNLIGSNQQSKANEAAQSANQAATDKQNNAAWTAWLMSRGIQPTTPVTYGTVPTAGNYTATNTRLPLWATVKNVNTATTPFLVKKTG